MNGSIARDPEVLSLLEKFRPQVEALTHEIIGATKVLLDSSGCRAAECNIGNMIADAFIHTRILQYNGNGLHWTDASLALIQGGGIRASAKVSNITKFDLRSILPFGDNLIIVNITGKRLIDALEHSVEKYTGDRGEFLQMSGIRVVFNMTNPIGKRVVSVDVMCGDCSVPHYEKLDLDKEYGTLLSSFLYNKGDGFDMFQVNIFSFISDLSSFITLTFTPFIFKDLKFEDMSILEVDAVEQYIKSMGIVYPVIDNRITIFGHIDSTDNSNSANSLGISISLILAVIISLVSF